MLSRSLIAYNITASYEKLTCTDYVDFANYRDRFGQFYLVQKRFKLVGCKAHGIQERQQERIPTGTKSYSGRGRLQPVHVIEKSAGHCSSKLW